MISLFQVKSFFILSKVVHFRMERISYEFLFISVFSFLFSYRNNVERLRNIMLDQTDKPLNRAMFWIEHILRHGGATHLRARVANMSWAEYLDTELMAVLALAFTTVILAISVILYVIIGYVKKYLSTGSKLKSN